MKINCKKIYFRTPIELVKSSLSVSLSSSPPPFCPNGRDSDIQAILDTINSAKVGIYIYLLEFYFTHFMIIIRIYWCKKANMKFFILGVC